MYETWKHYKQKENKMIEQLRIAVVVKDNNAHPVGTIMFADPQEDPKSFKNTYLCYNNINLKGKHLADCSQNIDEQSHAYFYCSQIFTTVIDTRTAKGDATLGAFLLMVRTYRYRPESDYGFDWDSNEVQADDAFKALSSLYKHGTLDDEVDVTCDGQTKRISRKSAIALGLLTRLEGE